MVVDAAEKRPTGDPQYRWVLGFSASDNPTVRAQFFTPSRSLWRLIDYNNIDGRLWRWITLDYSYPDDSRRYSQFECTALYTSVFNPDGTGVVKINDKSAPEISQTTVSDAPVDGFWLDFPQFGDWANLSNPEYGIPE